jgi:hypothetical protein
VLGALGTLIKISMIGKIYVILDFSGVFGFIHKIG